MQKKENYHAQKSTGARKEADDFFFMKPSPFIELYEADEEFSSNSHWDDSLCLSLTDDGLPLWAALSKTPPTTCTTPGKTRPSGYSKAGKWLPSKWIASKTDKRAGK